MNMNSRDRILTTLGHRQPDRIPFDLGGSYVTGITKNAYTGLARTLGIDTEPIVLCDVVQQLAEPGEELLQKLDVDTRAVVPNIARKSPPLEICDGEQRFRDEWGVLWHRPEGSLYFDIAAGPFAQELTRKTIDEFKWPDPTAPALFDGLEEKARMHYERGYAVMLENLCAGLFEMCCRVRGTEQFLMDLAMDPETACTLLDKFVELKLRYYEAAAARLGKYIVCLREVDDMAGQQSMLISPQMYRDLLKPRHKQLFDAQKKLFPEPFYSFFHSDGAILEIIPDLIETGVEILNPVQLTAQGMDAQLLKQRFGRDLVFWGGGVNTQQVLPHGTPQEVRRNVRERIAQLAPDGGFVFATVHNIQDDVPADNIRALVETWRELRDY